MNINAVVGVYQSIEEVKQTLRQLSAEGVPKSKISLLFPKGRSNRDLPYRSRTEVFNGARIGLVGGATSMALITILVGTGVLQVPGVGPFTWIQLLSLTLLGAILGGGVGAGAGALVGIGTPEPPVRRIVHYIQDGAIAISIQVDDYQEGERVKKILGESGGQDLTYMNEREVRDTLYAESLLRTYDFGVSL